MTYTRKMDFNEFQRLSQRRAFYPDAGNCLWYPALGLAGEAGEVANKVKKVYRDSMGVLSDTARREILGELGDVLWYVACVAMEAGLSLEQVAQFNVEKLAAKHNSSQEGK